MKSNTANRILYTLLMLTLITSSCMETNDPPPSTPEIAIDVNTPSGWAKEYNYIDDEGERFDVNLEAEYSVNGIYPGVLISCEPRIESMSQDAKSEYDAIINDKDFVNTQLDSMENTIVMGRSAYVLQFTASIYEVGFFMKALFIPLNGELCEILFYRESSDYATNAIFKQIQTELIFNE